MSANPSFGQGLELSGLIIKATSVAAKKYGVDSDGVQHVISDPNRIYSLVDNLFAPANVETKPSILHLISGGSNLMIESLDGKATIANAKKIFPSGIDSDFKNWNLNNAGAGQATGETLMDVHEMVADGTFTQIFTAITPDLEKIVMSQHQVIRFCEKYLAWLRQEGYGTFFLIKENGEYFVVNVDVHSVGLYACVGRLGIGDVWRGGSRLRVVAPQLIPLAA